MNTELNYDGYFDLTMHRKELETLSDVIATEGFSTQRYHEVEQFLPNAFPNINVKSTTRLPSKIHQEAALEAMDTLLSILPTVRVTEVNGIVTVLGVPTRMLTGYIYKHWKSTKIANNVLLTAGIRYFSFYSFYAIEIVYMLEAILEKSGPRAALVKNIIRVITENTWLADIKKQPDLTFDYSKLDRLNCTLLPNQMDYLKEYEDKTQRYALNGYVLAAPPGTGKALKNGTKVKTYTGWLEIEKLCVGDIVIGGDGKETKVTGVFPQGEVELFEFTFIDGRKITACKDHLWKFYDPLEKAWIVDNTVDMIRRMNLGSYLFIPLIENYGRDILNAYNRNARLFPKSINIINSSVTITTLDKDDALWFQECTWALGGTAALQKGKTGWDVIVRHPNLALLGLTDKIPARKMNLLVHKIRPVDVSAATCIQVDNNDHLFAAENYIVTHNTINGFAMSLASKADTTIFIVPNNSVEDVWESTILTRFKEVPRYWTSHQKKPIIGNEEYVVGHYESLKTILASVKKFGSRKIYIWLDESHNFNELSSSRTKMFVDLCKSVNLRGCTWASGTPFKAIGKEAVPMLRCIDPKFTEDVEKTFLKMFGTTKGQALDVLANRMGRVTFKVPKKDVVDNERLEFVQPVAFDGSSVYTLESIGKDLVSFIVERQAYYAKNMKTYEDDFMRIMDVVSPRIKKEGDKNRLSFYLAGAKKMHHNFQPMADRELVVECNTIERELIIPNLTNEEKRVFRKVASVYKYVSLTVRGEALGRILTRARIDCFKDMVPHANLKDIIDTARKKTLIFTSYVEVADAIKEQTEADGFKPLIVYGDTNKDLPAIMAEFKKNPKANPLIATFDSLSTAVPVIEASTVVMFNSPFRDYIRDQAVSRADRLGQDGSVTVANVLLDTGELDNISTRSKDIMQWSKEQVDAIMKFD